MRVYDLAKELGKDSSKEILDILEKHNINLKSSSNITDEQATVVRKEMSGHGRGASEARAAAPAGDESDAPKKKIAAVFRPQNAQNAQMKPQGQHSQDRNGSRPPQGQRGRDGRPPQGAGFRDSDNRNQQVAEQSLQAATDPVKEQYQGNRDGRSQGQGGYQGNRDGRPQGQGGYQGNRDGRPQGQGGYQGNRDGRPQGQGG
ncbi:translation initiation factor IF-2 N-terminal domain-containing protein, partial [Lachnospiraceae bacterium 54-53]